MNQNNSSQRLINHKAMRVVVGIIAILLSPVVWMLSGIGSDLGSISGSYWTESRDVFVGSLIAVGFFLFAYNGASGKRDWEYWISKLACVFAICVAIFPTGGRPELDQAAGWIQEVSGTFSLLPETIHYGSASMLFICLIALMWFFSVRAKSKGRIVRTFFYRGISVSMLVGIVGLYLIGDMLNWHDTIFWVEVWGLSLFGLGWLAAGSYRNIDTAKVKG